MLSLHLQLYSFILVILVCLLFLLTFFCFNDQKQATSSPTHISPSHQKWQNITRSWPKMDLSSYVEPLCVCVCVKLVYDSCQRECHNMLTHLSISLFFVWRVFGTIIYKNFKKERKLTRSPLMVLNKYFLIGKL